MNVPDDTVKVPNACYICGSAKLILHAEVHEFPLVKCEDCRVIYVPADRVSDEVLAEFYSREYYHSDSILGYRDYGHYELIHRRNANRILDRTLRSTGAEPLRVLDVGCAYGFFLDEARNRGATVCGVEMSDYAYRHAVDLMGLEVHRSLESMPENLRERFDVAYLLGTIEHLRDPREVVASIGRFLRPGGALVITTVDTGGPLPLYALSHRVAPYLFQPGEHRDAALRYWLHA